MFDTQQSLLARANDETLALYTRLEALQELRRQLQELEKQLTEPKANTT